MTGSGIAGVVLAGGRATRLGGGDKPLRLLGARPMLAHVMERIAPQVETLAISANGDPERLSGYGLPVLADDQRDAGPLAGIAAGMAWARTQTQCQSLLTVAGDTPFFPHDLATRLAEAVARGGEIAVAASGGRRHPVFALWPIALESELRSFVAKGETYSVAAFLDRHRTMTVEFPLTGMPGQRLDPFFNVNTPEDLAKAQDIVGGQTA